MWGCCCCGGGAAMLYSFLNPPATSLYGCFVYLLSLEGAMMDFVLASPCSHGRAKWVAAGPKRHCGPKYYEVTPETVAPQEAGKRQMDHPEAPRRTQERKFGTWAILGANFPQIRTVQVTECRFLQRLVILSRLVVTPSVTRSSMRHSWPAFHENCKWFHFSS